MGGLRRLKYAGGTEMDFFAGWCEENLRHSVDRWAGKPVKWERWQRDIFEEFLACDDEGVPYWKACHLIVPRKNGKTLMLAALAIYRLIVDEDQPEILLAASTDKQAGRLFEACISFLRKNHDLDDMVVKRESLGEIVNVDTGGKIIRLPSGGETLDGYNPSLSICDELHAWNTPTRRRVWTSLNTADAARSRTQVVAITTAGDAVSRQTSILGRLMDANEARGECERKPGVVISRYHEARTIIFNYSAPTNDPSDVKSMKMANPASWITPEFLLRKAQNPELTNSEVLQLHGCVWAEALEAWIPAHEWAACRVELDDALLPEGASIYVGIDVGLTHDSSAIAVSWLREDGRLGLQVTVWSALPSVPAHVHVPGGRMKLDLLEEYIDELDQNYRIEELAYDPRFFERSAQSFDDKYVVVAMNQNSAPMYDAYQTFYQGVFERHIAHNGDGILAQHLAATAAIKGERGWRISKIRSTQRIDAVPAACMALYRCEVNSEMVGGGVIYG